MGVPLQRALLVALVDDSAQLLEDAVRTARLVEGNRHRAALEVEDGVEAVDGAASAGRRTLVLRRHTER